MNFTTSNPIDLSGASDSVLVSLIRIVRTPEFECASLDHLLFAQKVLEEGAKRFAQNAPPEHPCPPDLLDTPAFMAAAGVKQP